MPSTSETFNFAYQVTESGGKFTVDASEPLATGVTVSDNNGILASHTSFKVEVPLGAPEQLVFVSLAKDPAGAQGFIAEDLNGHYFFFTQTDIKGSSHPLHLEKGVEHICFMPGTRIATPSGEVPVESLAAGDRVLSLEGDAVEVRWIGRQTISRLFADELRLPVRIKAGALADNVPARDLCVSPDHALFVDGILIHAGSLINGTSIVREYDAPEVFTYHHVEVKDHRLIMAENTPAETFIDNVGRGNFDNWQEYEALYPDVGTIAEMPYPRAKAYRQVPAAIRERLAARARLFDERSAAA
jgi:hypothetical protein